MHKRRTINDDSIIWAKCVDSYFAIFFTKGRSISDFLNVEQRYVEAGLMDVPGRPKNHDEVEYADMYASVPLICVYRHVFDLGDPNSHDIQYQLPLQLSLTPGPCMII